jgi:transposase-like protein
MLEVGVGPSLDAGMRCPACSASLGSWSGYRRFVRAERRTFRLLVRRGRCVGCGRTHALLPGFLLGRRRDVADAIGRALSLAAGGRGHRPIAEELGLAATTVRSWLRRLRLRADVLRGRFVALAVELAEPPARPPPEIGSLGSLERAIVDAFLAARLRFGPGGVVGGVWAFGSAATSGWLLANTDSPW